MTKLRVSLFALLVSCNNPVAEGRGSVESGAAAKVTAGAKPGAGLGAPRGLPSQPRQLVTAPTGQLALVQDPIASRGAWFDLTSSDGAGLVASKLEVKTVIEGPLAFTEMHLYFDNPEARVREGKFRITLPDGAAISRFAMEQDGQFMEAEVVEKKLARRAYEDFLHRRQDPALLEQAAGNEFSARVFPIAPNAQKHLVISFSQTLVDDNYRLPLRGLPTLASLHAEVSVLTPSGAYAHSEASKANWKPDADMVIGSSEVSSVMAGEMVAMRVPLAGESAPHKPSALAILIDTSASRALGFENDVARLEKIVAGFRARLRADVPLEVIAFDQSTEVVFKSSLGNWNPSVAAALRKRSALGASDLRRALAMVSPGKQKQVVLISDAVATVGDSADVTAAAKALAGRGVTRLDVVMVGGIRDAVAANSLVTAGLPLAGATLDADRLGSDEVSRRLGISVLVDMPVAVSNASWVWPKTASGQPGDHVMVYARLAPSRVAGAQVAATVGTMLSKTSPMTVAEPLVSRSIAQAHIAQIEAELKTQNPATAATTEKLKAELVKVSVQNRVLSSATSMLVLETDADYARYGIARDSLANILQAGKTGVELVQRNKAAPLVMAQAPKPEPTPVTKDKAKKADIGHAVMEDVAQANRGAAASAASGPMGGSPSASAPPSTGSRASRDDASDDGDFEGGEALKLASAEEPAEPAAPPPTAVPSAVTRQAPQAERAAAPRSESMREYRRQRASTDESSIASAGQAALEQAMPSGPAPLTGDMAKLHSLLTANRLDQARQLADSWHRKSPGDVLALIAVGEVAEASRDFERAARAYGAIIDMFPERADLRRFAGQRLAKLPQASAPQSAEQALLIDTYRQAVADRPDHPSSHRMLAFAYARAKQFDKAFEAITVGIKQNYPGGRFRGVDRVLREDAGILAAAWLAASPADAVKIKAACVELGIVLAATPSTRFVLYWETDANDVDFHIRDNRGGHAFYSQQELASGGELFEDVTTGYGPECFAINGKPKAGPYKLSIHYYSRGPMGYGMGSVETLRHDGNGGLSFETRPYLVMVDGAYVDLGTFK